MADALGKALAKRPADRFQGAGAFGDALATSPVGARGGACPPGAGSHSSLGVATLATLAGVAFLRRESAPRPPTPTWSPSPRSRR
ncbi:MAG: hypothetical protein IPN47_22165 [Gemmatimonadetes bacterium]|nr:hypothetical protein [Gemmatimonadota bacterium]